MTGDPGLDEAVLALYAETNTLTLATVNSDGSPRATPLFFAFDPDLSVLMLSDPETPHMRNLANSDTVGAAMYPAVDSWRSIRGLQLQARPAVLAGDDKRRGLQRYLDRFPFAHEMQDQLAGSDLVRLHPTWIRLIDNRLGFGHKREATLT